MHISLTLSVFLLCLLTSGSAKETAAAPDALPVLTTVSAIRQLAPEEARRVLPIQRGVVHRE
jgi:hypothetical protein